MNASETALNNAYWCLRDYYGFSVPEHILREVIEFDPDMLEECECGGIRDTCQRELLVDDVLKKIGVRSWPIYGEGDAVYQRFLVEMKAAVAKVGGEVQDERL